jgi:hypothetical protein
MQNTYKVGRSLLFRRYFKARLRNYYQKETVLVLYAIHLGCSSDGTFEKCDISLLS